MAAEQRKLLEQLMGASSTSRAAQLSLTDPKVCRSYLAGTCPHDLFTNTKQDIGPCPKVHNEGLKTEYEALSDREKQKYGFEYDYMRDLQKYIDDCNRRIDAAQRRLEKTPDEIRQTSVLVCLPTPWSALYRNTNHHSSKAYLSSQTPSTTASSKSKSSVPWAKSPAHKTSCSASVKPANLKPTAKRSSKLFPTHQVLQVIKSSKSAMSVVPTSVDLITIVASPITFTERCT